VQFADFPAARSFCLAVIFGVAAIGVSGKETPVAGVTAIPVAIRQDLVLISLRLPPSPRTFTFLLDTGAEITTLDKTVAQELHLAESNDADIQTIANDDTGHTAVLPELQVGLQKIRGLKVAVYDLASVTNSLGVSVGGVLGLDVLQNFAFTINYSKKLLLLENPRYVTVPSVALAVHLDKGGCLVPVSLNGRPGTELLLDTGTNMTQLPAPVWLSLLTSWTPRKSIAGLTSSGLQNSKSFATRLQSLQLGGYTVTGPVVRIWPQTKQGTFSEAGAPGLLASDVLRRFVVTVDLPKEKLWLTPDPDYKPDPYEFCSVGIQFVLQGKDFLVASVWDGSPAARAGILRGDHILKVQGREAAEVSREKLARLLHGPEGSVVNLVIQRGSRVFELPLRREELL
jgi:hypothetical protein